MQLAERERPAGRLVARVLSHQPIQPARQPTCNLKIVWVDGKDKNHCDATPDKIQAAIHAYKKALKDAEAGVAGSEYIHKNMKKDLRRLSL